MNHYARAGALSAERPKLLVQSRIRVPKAGAHGPAFKHSRAIPTVMHLFQELDIGVTLWNKNYWEELYERPDFASLIGFELEHGAELERTAYNMKALERAVKTRRTVTSERGGFCDLFVPVCMAGDVDSVLVCGPYASKRSSATDILERWRTITGRQGHPADPEFSNYLSITLSTLVLDPPQALKLQGVLEGLAKLMAGEGDPLATARMIDSLHPALTEARLVEKMWSAARLMVDERSSRMWTNPHRRPRRQALGISRFPEQAVVGLFVSRERHRNPVEDLLERDAFQRKCAELARRAGNVIVGQVGDHGVTFLGVGSPKGARRPERSSLVELSERAVVAARQSFGLDVHWGMSSGSGALPSEYQEALALAQSALARGRRILFASPGAPVEKLLGRLHEELDALLHEDPKRLPARFDRYLEAVAVRYGYRLEPAQVRLEASFALLVQSVLGRGGLPARAFAAFQAELERSSFAAGTMSELFAVYRHALADLLEAQSHPVAADRDRNLRRTDEYLRQHYAEPLTLRGVARVAGFAPAYFSVLFKKRQRISFTRRLRELRIERAKELLSRTDLSLARIAELSGLSNSHYLCRVFKRGTGQTPLAFRKKTDKLFTSGQTTGKEIRQSGELRPKRPV